MTRIHTLRWLGLAAGLAFVPLAQAQTAPVNDAPVVNQNDLRVGAFKEPTRVTTYLPANPEYNISTLAQRLQQNIPDLRRPTVALLVGGQPTPGAWLHAANAGVRTVINLRPASELGIRDEGTEVRTAGLRYFEIPVAGPQDLTRAKAQLLWQQLKNAKGGVLVHCASGNRASALLTMAAHYGGGMSVTEAMTFGRQAGLSGLAPIVQGLLTGAPVAPATVAPAKKPASR